MHRLNISTTIRMALLCVFAFIALGTVLFHALEDWTWIQAFYFSVVSMTTVGYGDLTPSNDITRLFVALYVLVSVTVMLTVLGSIGSAIVEHSREKHFKRFDIKKR